MQVMRSPTLYRRLTPRQALGVMALLAVALAYCLAVSGGEPWTRAGERGGDVALFEQVEQRLRGGEPYYDAMASELRSRGYQTRSVLNWRTPLHLSLIARLPSRGSAWVLVVIVTFAAIAMLFLGMWAEGQYLPVILWVPLGFASFASLMPGALMYSEVWAGALIAASAGAYSLRMWRTGAAAGILALFFRELALPYVLISLLLAWRRSRRSEIGVLLIGMAGYSIYFALHALAVTSRMTPIDLEASWTQVWIRFGGVRFLLTASRVGMLLACPLWATALYLPFAVLGLAGVPSPIGSRLLLTVGAYLAAFSVLGRPVQFYWGGVYAPLLGLGAAWSAPACYDLVRAILARRAKTD